VTLTAQESDFYFLNKEICRVGLDLVGNSRNLAEALESNFRRLTALRRVIVESRAHVVVSFLDQINVLTLLATFGKKLPIMVSERIDPRYHLINGVWSALRWPAYRRALAVIVQTQEVADWVRWNLGCSSVAVIPNPAILSDYGPSEVLLPQAPFIISVGRLVYQKGFDRLLVAFAQSLTRAESATFSSGGRGIRCPASSGSRIRYLRAGSFSGLR
jgi:glycosyltransferase involved in cell wall biosynthesis